MSAQNSHDNNNNTYKVIYMNGGSKKVKLLSFLEEYYKQYQSNTINGTPVFQKKKKQQYLITSYPFQADIDNIRDVESLNYIIEKIKFVLFKYYGDTINLYYYQFKRVNDLKYHLYYPNVIIKSEYMEPLINEINQLLKSSRNSLDKSIATNNIRLEGCLKIGEEGSNYILENDEFTFEVLKQICNYDVPPLEPIKPINIIKKKNKNDSIEINLSHKKDAKKILEQYKPYVISISKDDRYVYWTLKKRCKCLFVNRCHTNSNPKIYFNENIILFKCWADKCNKKVKCLYKNSDANDINFLRISFNNTKTKRDIPLELDATNYNERRVYFERFFIWISDEGKLYRYAIERNETLKIDNITIKLIEKSGYKSLKYHKVGPKSKSDDTLFKHTYNFVDYYTNEDQTNNFYRDITFNPSNLHIPGSYNLFKGYGYTKILSKDEVITDEDYINFEFVKLFIKQVLCENNQKNFNYLMSWIATIFQAGKVRRPQIMMILYSQEHGTGKTSFITKFLFSIIGFPYTYGGNYEDVYGDFTTATRGKLLIFIDEFNKYTGEKKDKKDEDKLKKSITDDNLIHKAKYQTEASVRNWALRIAATNHKLKFPQGDRRNVVYNVEKLGDEYKHIIDKIENIYEYDNKVKYLFGEYFTNYDIPYKTNNDWIKNRPKTEIYKEMTKRHNLFYFLEQLYYNKLITERYYNSNYDNVDYTDLSEYYLTQHNIKDPKKKPLLAIKENIFYSLYRNFCKANGYRAASDNTIKNELKKFKVSCIKSKKVLNNVSNVSTYKFALFDLYNHINPQNEPYRDYHTQDDTPEQSDNEEEEKPIQNNKPQINILNFFSKKKS